MQKILNLFYFYLGSLTYKTSQGEMTLQCQIYLSNDIVILTVVQIFLDENLRIFKDDSHVELNVLVKFIPQNLILFFFSLSPSLSFSLSFLPYFFPPSLPLPFCLPSSFPFFFFTFC
jgi:hypothetical protein